MDNKLNELKEKQTEIGNKISLLQQTNKKKDEETEEIRKLIAECRENLNRIKAINPNESDLLPCEQIDLGPKGSEEGPDGQEGRKPNQRSGAAGTRRAPDDPGADRKSGPRVDALGRRRSPDDPDAERKSGPRSGTERSPANRQGRPDSRKKKQPKDRVSCKVDVNRMKVRIRGPSEDLKKLDATQLISLLERYQCQELIINTGDEHVQDPGEVRLIYFLHPGNIVMVAGIIMIAYLINSNVCHVEHKSKAQLPLQVLYLSSSAFHYGMVLWMIFIRGYALRFGLNQDMFHLVDSVILPKYFSVCVLLSALSLYSFLVTHAVSPCSSWPLDVIAQILIGGVTFFTELVTVCYVIPALIKLRDATDDYIIEDEEPDSNVPPSYKKNLVKLGKLNWTLCLINLLTLLLLSANIYFITSKLRVGSAA